MDKVHKLIRKWDATDASVHDSQKMDDVLDLSNTGKGVRADSAYRSAQIEADLKADDHYSGHLEQYRLSAISVFAEERCRARAEVSPQSGTVFYTWPATAASFARCHTDSARERTQAGAAAIRSS